MSPLDLVQRIERLGVAVSLVEGDRIKIEPGESVPATLKDELKAHRAEVVSSLRLRGWVSQWRELMQELSDGSDHYMRDDCPADSHDAWIATMNIVEYIDIDILRRCFGFSGCPAEGGKCDPEWPIRCACCAELVS